MMYVVLAVLIVLIVAALWWGNRRAKDADEDIKYMNEGRGVGQGILGVFGKGRKRS